MEEGGFVSEELPPNEKDGTELAKLAVLDDELVAVAVFFEVFPNEKELLLGAVVRGAVDPNVKPDVGAFEVLLVVELAVAFDDDGLNPPNENEVSGFEAEEEDPPNENGLGAAELLLLLVPNEIVGWVTLLLLALPFSSIKISTIMTFAYFTLFVCHIKPGSQMFILLHSIIVK